MADICLLLIDSDKFTTYTITIFLILAWMFALVCLSESKSAPHLSTTEKAHLTYNFYQSFLYGTPLVLGTVLNYGLEARLEISILAGCVTYLVAQNIVGVENEEMIFLRLKREEDEERSREKQCDGICGTRKEEDRAGNVSKPSLSSIQSEDTTTIGSRKIDEEKGHSCQEKDWKEIFEKRLWVLEGKVGIVSKVSTTDKPDVDTTPSESEQSKRSSFLSTASSDTATTEETEQERDTAHVTAENAASICPGCGFCFEITPKDALEILNASASKLL